MVLIRLVNRFIMAAFVSVLIFCAAGCDKVENEPEQVADKFVQSVKLLDTAMLDSLMAWDEVAINQFYVPRNYYNALTEAKQREIVASYKELFFKDYLPVASTVNYTVEHVYIARGSSNAIVSFTSPSQEKIVGEKKARKQFLLEMSLYPDRSRWYIIDLNEFVHLIVLKGDYDPDKFYLPEPIN